MKKIQLTKTDKRPVVIFFTNNLTIATRQEKAWENGDQIWIERTVVMDGLHNNGGWEVLESFETVVAMIEKAIA